MGNCGFYTKGDHKDVLSRINQVHTITMFCPLEDSGVQVLKSALDIVLPQYKESDDLWKGIPTIDALNTFLFAGTFCKRTGFMTDKKIMEVIISSLQMFTRLKYINFEFTLDHDMYETYKKMANKEKDSNLKYIYRIERIEMNLSDLFSQPIIDLLNKVFMHNELLPNSYLYRKFRLDFSFDEYVAFMDMFLGNNHDQLNSVDTHICDYFRTFPKLVNEQKPNIRLITNYEDEATE